MARWVENLPLVAWEFADYVQLPFAADQLRGISNLRTTKYAGRRNNECLMNVMDHPHLVLILSLVGMWLFGLIGDFLHGNRDRQLKEETREYFTIVLSANLTLLGLLIGFSFSMAINRYDQRKNYEEAEANAIGTEYVRADLLPPQDAAKVKELLRMYTAERIQFYTNRSPQVLATIWTNRSELQNQLWESILPAVNAHPSQTMALVTMGMNDVINSQGYTQAAWWNRIPVAAWVLMAAIAAFCNLMIGYGARGKDHRIYLMLPIAISVSFYLISDIDSPRGGTIQVLPVNLTSFLQSVTPP
jgi:hypothetical protein